MRSLLITFCWAVIVMNMAYFLLTDTRASLIAWGLTLLIMAPIIYLRHRKRVR